MNRRVFGLVWPFAAAALLLAVVALSVLGGDASKRAQYVPPVPALHRPTPSQCPPTSDACRREIPDASKGGHYPVLKYPFYALLIGAGMVVALVFLGMWVAIALGLFGIGSNVRLSRRLRAGPVENEVPDDTAGDARAARQLGRAVDAGLADLAAGEDARTAVIACWSALERAAAQAGTARRDPETPAELAGRLLVAHAVSADSLALLAELYREARYSPHRVDDEMRTRARAALTRIRAELAVPAGDRA